MRNRYSSKKKLGVLVSSLALVAVTAMAGVTGTAAWFTANRAATATASTFTAYAPQASLSITANGIQDKGTYADSNSSAVYVREGSSTGSLNYLRDASYDAITGTLYRANVDDSASSETSATVKSYSVVTDYDTGSSVTVGSDSHKVYYAVSWTYTLSYSNPNANGSALFFDPVNSSFANGNAKDTTISGIEKGFRIAMNGYKNNSTKARVNTNGYIVWANDKSSTVTKTYVDGTSVSSNDSSTYSSNFFETGNTTSLADDGISSSVAEGRSDYIGVFTASTDTITITCTAWYEGTDTANVVTSKAKQIEAIQANMRFYVRDLATTTSNTGTGSSTVSSASSSSSGN